ncbi:hypothetical protein H112_04583 [Trichophyton rubrum D6]|nr:hypothetical protein H100_04590 [Trichophyton rubrum MR850]EZF41667.1 hypothetical protein H102_04577 [Trichophyton rubrum CBS 100081]EZF52337.1 hypothetical protein H103_04585 [Trichophyton rubrum CBS 288.86]EZF62837.1 hypothetical protein H104_04573 [Trichophyton rubrum CBS 289.86]EZF73545.1 hypothetical protein H105_04600 [Trichophyton soudanense CBS 452.61]EZF84250.1 hypothetical protein H110_04578 [Trichophyton rubrum MR1448]EZG16547.1 hypothetical protein H107_04712 [Trichophyton rub
MDGVNLVRRVSTSLQAGTVLGRRDAQSHTEQEEYLTYAIFMVDFIPLLAVAIYILLAVVIGWKYIVAAVTKGRSLFAKCRRGGWPLARKSRHRDAEQGLSRHNRYRGIDVGAYGGQYELQELELGDDEDCQKGEGEEEEEDDNDNEGIFLLHYIQSGQTPQQQERDPAEPVHQPPPDDSRHSLDNIITTTSNGVSKYFHPTSGRLRNDIVHPTQTRLDRMLGDDEDEGHGSIAWYKALQRFSDKFILKAQAWLDKEEARMDRVEHRETSNVRGESNRAIRQILRERREERGYKDAEDNLY